MTGLPRWSAPHIERPNVAETDFVSLDLISLKIFVVFAFADGGLWQEEQQIGAQTRACSEVIHNPEPAHAQKL